MLTRGHPSRARIDSLARKDCGRAPTPKRVSNHNQDVFFRGFKPTCVESIHDWVLWTFVDGSHIWMVSGDGAGLLSLYTWDVILFLSQHHALLYWVQRHGYPWHTAHLPVGPLFGLISVDHVSILWLFDTFHLHLRGICWLQRNDRFHRPLRGNQSSKHRNAKQNTLLHPKELDFFELHPEI
jgi:hypothetical protein